MSNLKITLVSFIKNPVGYVISADDLDSVVEMADLSIREGLEKLWIISSDVSLSHAQKIAREISKVASNDLLVVGHSDKGMDFAISYGRIDSFDIDRLSYLSSMADSRMVSRIFSFCTAQIKAAEPAAAKKWYEVIVKVENSTGLEWKKNQMDKEETEKVVPLFKNHLEINGQLYYTGDEMKVDSSAVRSVSYNIGKAILKLNFHDGLTRIYRHVPSNVFRQLVTADSVGRYYQQHVRDEFEVELVYEREIVRYQLFCPVIESISYKTNRLTVYFKKGSSYHYHNVPRKVALQLMGANKPISYFSKDIKPHYDSELNDTI